MTFPLVPLTNQWTDGEELNAAKMQARVDQNLNALIPTFTSYVPAWTGFTVGNATNLGFYQVSGKALQLSISLLIGSTSSSFSSAVTVSIPPGFTASSTLSSQYIYALQALSFSAVGTASIAANATTMLFYFPPSTTASNITQFNSAGTSSTTNQRIVVTGSLIIN